MPARKPAQGYTIQEWLSLPVLVTPDDVVSIHLTKKEVDTIVGYADEYFDRTTIDKMPSQWAITKGKKRNPNATGIRGEWAVLKYLAPHLAKDLTKFLAFRPWRMADMGDALLVGRKPKIFDFKTRTRRESIEELLKNDKHMAEMDAKFSNRERYGYLEAFVFCVNDEEHNAIHILGWMPAEKYFEKAQLVKKGETLPGGGSYFNDCVMVPYRRLRPVSELLALEYHPITEQMTKKLKEDWHVKGVLNVAQFLNANL